MNLRSLRNPKEAEDVKDRGNFPIEIVIGLGGGYPLPIAEGFQRAPALRVSYSSIP